MPVLRSGRRSRRAPVGRKISEPADKYVKTRAAKKKEQKKKVIEISESDNGHRDIAAAAKKEGEEIEGTMGDESGGLSANKGVAQEDEGNTTPFPERV